MTAADRGSEGPSRARALCAVCGNYYALKRNGCVFLPMLAKFEQEDSAP